MNDLQLNFEHLKEFLDEKALQYNKNYFIDSDPIQVPLRFSDKEDIELIAFLTATIAWGKRDLIIKSANKISALMDEQPYQFIMNFDYKKDAKWLNDFKHRTFNQHDLCYFMIGLKNCIMKYGSLENSFTQHADLTQSSVKFILGNFHDRFFEIEHPYSFHAKKHVANPLQGSAAKRLNMFLRWMVRKDAYGVDFGIWNSIPTSILSCPLDVHTGNVGRKLKLITRNQNDWKTVEQLDTRLREFDYKDPVKYDFALFGLGVFENF